MQIALIIKITKIILNGKIKIPSVSKNSSTFNPVIIAKPTNPNTNPHSKAPTRDVVQKKRKNML